MPLQLTQDWVAVIIVAEHGLAFFDEKADVEKVFDGIAKALRVDREMKQVDALFASTLAQQLPQFAHNCMRISL